LLNLRPATKVVSDNLVQFDSADRLAHVLVNIQPATPEQISISTTLNKESEKANVFGLMLLPGEKVLELDFTRYFLSGIPAVRVIEIQSFGEPGRLPAASSLTPQDYDFKAMVYNILLDGNWYKVAYAVIPPEDFPKYLQTAQSMIDSFQIINKQ
jgi:hypothetical protein